MCLDITKNGLIWILLPDELNWILERKVNGRCLLQRAPGRKASTFPNLVDGAIYDIATKLALYRTGVDILTIRGVDNGKAARGMMDDGAVAVAYV